NLQTLAEDLGVICGGKAWIIVTGQQDIDSIVKVVGNNFSKIQGRFDTRIALSSADVDVVIRKRILEKNKIATPMLEMMYDQKASIIKNAVVFSDTAEMKIYQDKSDFASDYPFIPYQFYILGRSLNAIREHGSSGKHMSEGERSMIALFQESAKSVMHQEQGVLVPFCNFYAPIEKFVDSNHSSVITNAAKNAKLVDIDVQILKVLFMIKHVKEMTATVDNITTLMLSSIDQDRLLLRKEVEESLQRLIKQTLVQKTLYNSNDIFVFLTNEEQDIAREIAKTNVEGSEIIIEISNMLFNDIYANSKFKYDSTHNYSFNKIVDDRYYGNVQSNDIGIKVITPLNGFGDSTAYRMQSQTEKNVLIVLPEQMPYCEEIRSSLQINKYLTKNTLSTASNIKAIVASKQAEVQERKNRAKLFLEEAVKDATIYFDGAELQSSARDAGAKIDEAIQKLFTVVYNKLQYIDSPISENDILNMFSHSNNIMIDMQVEKDKNSLAINDVLDFISINTYRKVKTSLKTLKDRYMKAPYGFNDADIEWITAQLFKRGDINMTINSDAISITNKSADELYRYFVRKEFLERLLFEKREKVSDKQKKAAKQVLEVLFAESGVSNEEDAIISLFKKRATALINYDFRQYETKYTLNPHFPGCAVLKNGREILQTIVDIEYPSEFFNIVDNRADDLIDFHDEYEKIKEFFKGEQVKFFEKALQAIQIYEDSKTYIADVAIDERIEAVNQVVKKANPYSEIYRLPELLDAFYKKYDILLDSIMEPAIVDIGEARARVFDELNKTDFKDKQTDRVIKIFDDFKSKAESSVNIATLKNLSLEVETMKVRLINEFDEAQRKIDAQKQQQNDNVPQDKAQPVVVKHRKIVTLKSVISGQSWNVSTESDLDKCLADIKVKLMKELASGEIKVED
ncbi:MAG: BREX system P-loop protein BrxC, partial [Clostridia bacterium]